MDKYDEILVQWLHDTSQCGKGCPHCVRAKIPPKPVHRDKRFQPPDEWGIDPNGAYYGHSTPYFQR